MTAVAVAPALPAPAVPALRDPVVDAAVLNRVAEMDMCETVVALCASDMPTASPESTDDTTEEYHACFDSLAQSVPAEQVARWVLQGIERLGEPLVWWLAYRTAWDSVAGHRDRDTDRHAFGSPLREETADSLAMAFPHKIGRADVLDIAPDQVQIGHETWISVRTLEGLRRWTATDDSGRLVFTGPEHHAGA